MSFTKYAPSDGLKPYINCYWLIEDQYRNVSDISFPDGCIEIVFSVNLDVYRKEENSNWAKGHLAEIIGQMTKPYHINVNGEGKVFGVRFYPDAFDVFFRDKLSCINDCSICVSDVFGEDLVAFAEECLLNDESGKLIGYIERMLMQRLSKARQHQNKNRIVRYAVQSILKSPQTVNLEKITSDCNITGRYLQKLFMEKVGLSPKHFVRIVRFQNSLIHLNGRNENLTTIGYLSGYFDQAHFIREFKSFSGLTPLSYQLKNHPVNGHFLIAENHFLS